MKSNIFKKEYIALVHGSLNKTEQIINAPIEFPSSNAFVPAVAGLVAAGEVIKDIAKGVDNCGK